MEGKLINFLENLLYQSWRNGNCIIDEYGREDMIRTVDLYHYEYVEMLKEINCYRESKGEENEQH